MKLRAQNPPHIRARESNLTMMLDAVLAIIPLYAMATYYYGVRTLALGALGVAFALGAELICQLIAGKVPNIRDLSSIVTGLLIPLLMPAAIRFEIVAIAAIFAIAVAKNPFGGTGQNIFNPAAAGAAFAMICWPRQMFAYPVPFDRLAMNIGENSKLVSSPAKALALGGVPTTDLMDMLVGNVSGPMGATCVLVLMTCLLYLLVKRTISLSMTFSLLAGAALVAALFPRAMFTPTASVAYELMSGVMLIGAIFLINDPVTSPKRAVPKLVYGFSTGILGMLFRHLGRYEESLLFAILLMNATVWILDIWGEHLANAVRRKTGGHKAYSKLSKTDADGLGDVNE